MRWPSWAIGYRLYRASNLTPPVSWQLLPGVAQDDGTWKTLALPLTPTNTFYRLGW